MNSNNLCRVPKRRLLAVFCWPLLGRHVALSLVVVPRASTVQTPVDRRFARTPDAASSKRCGDAQGDYSAKPFGHVNVCSWPNSA